ncbi:beta strand repeat-containing protein [Hyalangium gracile]|uniref:beta strand repeat-containing protein n=1 Tax=Hyalangium gracile TaxID=394092 RepID=UPI001CC8F3B8|nr:Ig-like domain-containing protein [Hyalangium gracile]
MSTRLPLALLLLVFAGCIDGSTPVNVGVTRGDPDATQSTVEVVPATGVLADGVATALVKVTVRDRNSRVLPGQAVSFTATGSDNTLVQPTATDASGMTQGTIASTRAETKTLTVRVGTGDKAIELTQHPQVTFVPGTASRLVFVTQPPASVRAGERFTPAVQLRVMDAQGNVVTAPVDVTLSLASAPNGATLGGTATRTTADGTVSFNDLLVNRAGTGYMLTATGQGLGSAVSSAFDVTAGPVDPSRTLVEVSKSTVVADGTDSTTITVTVRDAFDNPVSGQAVSVSSTGADNALTPGSGTSGANGTFTATLRSTTAETKTIAATVGSTVAPPRPQVTFVPGTASRLVFVVEPPAQTVAGQTMTPAIQLQVLDAQGNPVTSATADVTLTLEPVASGATLGGTTTRALSAGAVSFNDLNVQKAGTGYTLRATGPGLTDVVSNAFSIIAGPADLTRTLVEVSKTTVTADGADSTTVKVTARDAYDNAVSGQAVGIAASGSNNTLMPASGTTGTDGSFSGTLRSTRAEVKTVSATLNGLSVAVQPQVTFVAAPATRLAFIVQPPAQTVAGQTLAPAIEVEVLDAQGNRVTSATANVTLTLEPVSSGATLSGTTTRALFEGHVSFNDLKVQKAGTGYVLHASGSGLAGAISNTFDIVAGPLDLTRTLVEVSKTTVTADGTDSTSVKVTARDAYDNAVSGQTVGLTASGSNNTLTPGSGTTGADGSFSATLTSIRAEPKTISATLNGNAVSTQPQVTFIAGPPVSLAYVTQPPAQTVAGQTMAPVIQVETLDAQGNRAVSASVSVTLALEPAASGATLDGTATRSVASGVASFNDLNVKKAGTGYTLRATATGLTAAVSTAFNIVTGPVDPLRTLVEVSKTTVTADGADSTTVKVTVRDTYDNGVSGQTVGLTASGSGNTLTPPSGSTGADGSFSATLTSTRAELKTISATLNGNPVSTQPQVTFIAGPPVRLAYVTQPPPQTVAGQTLTPALQVEVLDAQGNRVASPNVSVTLVLEPAASGATLDGTATRQTASGVAGFNDLNVKKAGTGYTLRATATGLTAAVSNPFDIVAAPVDLTRTLVEVSKTTVTADGTDFTVVTVTVRDAYDNPVPGQAVVPAVTGSNNTLTPPSGSTSAGGTFSATLTSIRAETKTISATVNGTAVSPQPQVTFVPGPAVRLAFVTQPPAQTVAGQTLTPALQVEALDAQGNRVASPSVSVTLVLEPAASGATLDGTATQQTASGVASFGDLNIKKAGTGYTLRATAAGLTPAVSNAFNIIADTPSLPQTTVTVSKSSVIADGLDFTTITVTVRDAFGNPVSGQSVGLGVSGADNTLSSTSGTTAADGTFSATLSSILAELKTVSATLNGNPVAQQPQVTFTAGPAVALNFLVEPPATVSAGQTLAPSVRVEVLDGRGNRVASSTATVTLVLDPVASGVLLRGTVSRAVVAGVATFDDLFVEQSGTAYTLRASAAGLSNAVSSPFDVTAGAPNSTTSTLTVTPASVVADNVAEATITVTVKDQYGNPVASQAVNVTASGVNNTLTPASGTSGADGRFVARLRSTRAEVKSVDATAAALVLPTASVTFVAGPIATLSLSAAPTQVEANGMDPTTLTATAEDAFGNRVPGVPIVFAAPGTGNVFNPGDGPTDVNGQRITTLTSTSTGTKIVTATGAGRNGLATVTFLRPPANVSNPVLTTSSVSGCAAIQYTVTQSASARADIIVEYEQEGVFKRATQAGATTGSGVQGVATSPTGVTHTFHWNSTADLSSSNETIRMRVTAQVPGALPSSAILNGVVMANGLHFAPPGLLPAGSTPKVVARADVNNDGRTDLVVGSAANDVQVLLGNGMGSFGAPTAVAVGASASVLLVRDVDGDGKADVLAGGSNTNIYLLKGTGTGTFGAATVATTLQGPPEGLAVGDFNRDGKLDLAATSGVGTVEVALATTAGVFAAPTRTNVGGSPGRLMTADLNLDARLDLLFVDSTQDVRTMLGTGAGTFGVASTVGVGPGASALTVSDVNLDGRPDVLAGLSSSSALVVARGNGDGTFSSQPAIPLGGTPEDIAVADMNEDGFRDVVVSGVGSDVLLLAGKSDGSLSTTPLMAPAGGPTTRLVVLDADRSGRPDVVAVRPAANGVAVLLSLQADRCETAFIAGLQLPVSPSPAAATVADLDGDGRPDLVVAVGGAVAGASALNIAKGRGNGTFSPFTAVSLGTTAQNPQGVAAGDLNADGRLDLVSANANTNTVSVLLDNGAGGYSTPSPWNTGSSPRAVAIADFDADGKVDLAVANGSGSNVTVLYGNGDGTFPTSFTFNVGVSPQSLVAVDLNGDGKPDIVTANFGGNNVTSLRNNGGRTSTSFTSLGNSLLGYPPRAIATGDFNADNKPDIAVVGNPSSVGSVSVMLGAGDGTLGGAITTSANLTTPEFKDPRGMVVGDFDADGQQDVMVSNFSDATLILLKGLGNGRFSIGPVTATGTAAVGLVGGDVDGDGKPDLVGPITADNRVFVLRSKGSGVPGAALHPVQTGTGAVSARGVTVVDMNKDGKLDVLTANRSSNKVSLLLGDGTGSFLLSPSSPTVGTSPSFIAAGDVDRDGNMDAVVTNNNTSTPSLSVLLGDGNGGLTKVATDLSNSAVPRSVSLADFNGDGALDLLTSGSAVYLRLNNGSGGFLASTAFTVGGTSQYAVVADFNQDGRPDVASANASSGSTVGVLLGNGAGGLVTPAKVQGLGGNGVALAAADFDRDGKVDLAVTTSAATGYEVKVLKGRGDGTFEGTLLAALPFTSPSQTPDWLTVGDVDGDGRLDIVTVVLNSDAILVWRGDGAGGFSGPMVLGASDQTQSVALADVNSDGLTDIIAGGFSLVGVLLGR